MSQKIKLGDVVVWYEPFDDGTWDWGVSTVCRVNRSIPWPIVIDWPNVLPDDLIEGKDWCFSDGAYGNCFPDEYIFKVGTL
jgi:hypothetical protein